MKVISIVNLKGGVGKTVTTVNLASILVKDYGKRVLVIDADPQASASRFYLKEQYSCDSNTITGILQGMADYYEDYIYHTDTEKLDIVPADISLIECDIASIRRETNCLKYLGEFCEVLVEDDICDYVIIDCPPSFTAASVAAITAADEVIIPVKIDAWSMAGVNELLTQINSLKRINYRVRVPGILITMWHNAEIVKLGEAALRESEMPVFKTVIRRTDKVDESTYAGVAVHEWSKQCSAGKDYRAWVQEYLGKELSRDGGKET